MKKIIFICFFFLFFSSFLCFAEASLEFTGGISSYSSYYGNDYSILDGYSFGISSRIKIIKNFGIGIHSNFFYFSKIVSGDNEGALVFKNKDFDFLFGFDFLLGPSFMLVNKNRIKVPLTVGFRGFGMTGLMSIYDPYKIAEISIIDISYGIGFALSLEIHLSRRFFLICRIQGGFDFFYYSAYELETYYELFSESDYGLSKIFSICPQIGFAIRF